MVYQEGDKREFFITVHSVNVTQFSIFAKSYAEARALVHSEPFPELCGGRVCTKITIKDEYGSGAEVAYFGDMSLLPKEDICVPYVRNTAANSSQPNGDN